MKRLFAAYPGIFLLVALAFTIDVVLIASTGALWRNSSFALGSAGAAIFLLGSASILRFVVFRNRIHLAISWVFIVFLWFGWFVIKALTQSPQYASFLLIMCLVAAFKTMRLEQSEEEKNAAEHRGLDAQPKIEENEAESPEHSKEHQIPTDRPAYSSPTEKTTEPISPSAILATSSTGTDTGDNQSGLRSLKQVLAIMAAIGCLVALWDMPDDYYKVLRLIVLAACGVIIWDIQKSSASDARKTWFTVAFGMLAVFFNPIMPIELDDDTWRWVTLTGAVGFTLLEVGKSAAISLAIVATVSLVAIDYAKEQKQIAYNKAFEENMKRIRDEENKKKLEEQEIREKQWAEWEAERLKKKQIEEERYEKAKIEWQRKEEEKKRVDQENEKRRELESQKYLEAERKRKEFLDKQIRESDARIAAYKKQRDAALAKKEFTIVGQVKNPGTYDYGLLTLNIFKAIEKAGGWTRQANMEEIKVKRTINGENQTLIVNTRMLTDKPWGSFDIMAGDVIEVSKK
jgi:hypothetical protein